MVISALSLLFLFTASNFGSGMTAQCVCTQPVMDVVPGEVTCSKMSLNRNFFESLETRKDCAFLSNPATFSLENVKQPFSLTASYFIVPKNPVALLKFEITHACVQKMSGNFFTALTKNDELTIASFRNITCLTTLASGVFSGFAKLNTLRWIGGDLTTIDADAFRDLPSLEELAITGTKLQTLPSVLQLDSPNLKDVSLRENQIETIPSKFFDLQTNQVMNVDLSKNRISSLPKDLFSKCKLNSLKLTGNQLTAFDVSILGPKNQASITQLFLASNLLTKLNESLIRNRTLEKLTLTIEENPWNCACSSTKWILYKPFVSKNTKCASPDRLKGREVEDLTEDDLCPKKTDNEMGGGGTSGGIGGASYSTVTSSPKLKGAGMGGSGPSKQELIAIGTSVAVIVVALVVFFLIYRYRGRICKSNEKKEGNHQYQPANTAEGYDGEPMRTYVV